jgi:hypothetical protein
MKHTYYEEEDFVVEPRVKQGKKKKKEDDWDWYPYETPISHKPTFMMAPQKKRDVEEYNFQRRQRRQDEKIQIFMRKHLEDQNIPRDLIDDILTRAGFYIPRVLVFR